MTLCMYSKEKNNIYYTSADTNMLNANSCNPMDYCPGTLTSNQYKSTN